MSISADAGGDHGPIDFGDLAEDVALDGTGSSTTTGSISEYLWTIVSGPSGHGATLDDETLAEPTLQNVDIPGNYILFLVVRDTSGNISAGGADDGFGTLIVDDYYVLDTDPQAFSIIRATTQYADLELPDDFQASDDWGDPYRDLVAKVDALYAPGAAPAPASHAASHEDGGSDELTLEDLATGEINTSKVLNPDGAGGVVWGSPPAATVPDPLTVDDLTVNSEIVAYSIRSEVAGLSISSDVGDITIAPAGDIRCESDIKVDGISELTTNAGVTIEGSLLRDGNLTAGGDVVAGGHVVAGTGESVYSNTFEGNTGLDQNVYVKGNAVHGGVVLYPQGDGSVWVKVDGSGYLRVDKLGEYTADNGVDIEDCNIKDGTVSADTIAEATSDQGVQIDQGRIRDGVLYDKNGHFSTWPSTVAPSTTDWEDIATLRSLSLSEVPALLSRVEVLCFFYTFGYASGTLQLRLVMDDQEIVSGSAFTPDAVPGGQLFSVRASLINTSDSGYGQFYADASLRDLTNGTEDTGGDGGGGSHAISPSASNDIKLQAKWSVVNAGNQIKISASDVRVVRQAT